MHFAAPCKDCQKRRPGCHDSCIEYLTAKAVYDSEKQQARKRKAVECQYQAYVSTKNGAPMR
jgi:hypothetical protein